MAGASPALVACGLCAAASNARHRARYFPRGSLERNGAIGGPTISASNRALTAFKASTSGGVAGGRPSCSAGLPPSMKTPSPQRGQKPVCGQTLERNGPNRVLVAGGSTFNALAQALGRVTRGFVGPVRIYDKTGITDTFDWILEFSPEEGRASSSPPEPTDVPPGPTIFSALQQQLGLRLEPAQAPRDYIVIDRIERPSPN